MQITSLTQNADQDQLSEQDYAEIFSSLRAGRIFDEFVKLVGSQYSKGQWSKYATGRIQLNRVMRNELRRTLSLPALPPTVEEVCRGISPAAHVFRIGEGVTRQVLLIDTPVALTMRSADGIVTAHQIAEHKRALRKLIRPVAAPDQKQRVLELGVTWHQVINAGLYYLSGGSNGAER